MAGEQIRYVLDVDDKGTPKLIKFGQAGEVAGKKTQTGMNAAGTSVQGVTDALARQVYQLNIQKRAMASPEYKAHAEDLKRIKAEIAAMDAPAKSWRDNLLNVKNLVGGFIALQAVGYVKDFGKAIYHATAEMDSMRRGLIAVMGSSTAAAAEMEKLKEVAKLPGLGYGEAIRMSTSLQAAGMSADMARKSMSAFGNALATVGKGKEELQGVGLALSQIMSKGKVSAEEINQIAERVPQIRKAMQDAFGTADTELLGKVGVSSANFIAAITEELGKLEKATGGVKTGSENLSDAWFRLKASIGGSGTVFTAATGWLANIAEQFADIDKYNDAASIRFHMNTVRLLKGIEAEGKALSEGQKERLKASRDYLAGVKRQNDKAAIEAEKARQIALERERQAIEDAADKELGGKKYKTEQLLKIELTNYKATVAAAKRTGASLELVERAHIAAMKRIREENAPKAAKAAKPKADKEAEARRKAELDAEIAADKAAQERVDEHNKRLMEGEAWIRQQRLDNDAADERRKAEQAESNLQQLKDEEDAFRDSMQARLGMHNGALTEMIRGKQSFSDTMAKIEDDSKNYAIQKGLEFVQEWITQQVTMALFGDAMRAAEAAKAAATGTAQAAAYAPAAAMASVASWGSAAVVGGAALAATLAQFAFRDRGGTTMTGGATIIGGENRPEVFRPTVPGHITNNTNNIGGDTIIIKANDTRGILRELETAKARRTRGAR